MSSSSGRALSCTCKRLPWICHDCRQQNIFTRIPENEWSYEEKKWTAAPCPGYNQATTKCARSKRIIAYAPMAPVEEGVAQLDPYCDACEERRVAQSEAAAQAAENARAAAYVDEQATLYLAGGEEYPPDQARSGMPSPWSWPASDAGDQPRTPSRSPQPPLPSGSEADAGGQAYVGEGQPGSSNYVQGSKRPVASSTSSSSKNKDGKGKGKKTKR